MGEGIFSRHKGQDITPSFDPSGADVVAGRWTDTDLNKTPGQVAADISAGAEALGLPPTLPSAETTSDNAASSQAGLASARVRLGGDMSGNDVAAEALDIATDRITQESGTTEPGLPSVPAPATEAAQESSWPPAQTSDRTSYWVPATQAQIDNAKKLGFDLQRNNDKYYQNRKPNNTGKII